MATKHIPVLTGKQLRTLRKTKGWTQEHVADLLGFTGSTRANTIYRMERGERPISYVQANLLLAIAIHGYRPTDLVAADRFAK